MAKEVDNLASDARKAKAAGMSYGKWKATQTPVVIPKKPPKECFTTIVCKYCGCEFVQFDKRKRIFCGDKCRMEYHDRKRYWGDENENNA